MVGVAMVAILAMILIRRVVRGGEIGVHAVMMVMVVHVKTDGRYVVSCMPIRAHRRRPGNLERNDEHDDQGDETTHGADSTDYGACAKRPIVPVFRRRRLAAAGSMSGTP